MYAEACLGTGDEATAKTYINKVRDRVGLGEVGTYSIKINGVEITSPTVEQCLRHERRMEGGYGGTSLVRPRALARCRQQGPEAAHGRLCHDRNAGGSIAYSSICERQT